MLLTLSPPIAALCLAFGYFVGSIPFGLILTKAAGAGDLRAIGSGNIGATNVLRTGRRGLAAATLGLDAGRLRVGAPADLIRFDPEEPYVLDPARLRSRCRNTPFDAARMEGVVKLTLVAGEIAHA